MPIQFRHLREPPGGRRNQAARYPWRDITSGATRAVPESISGGRGQAPHGLQQDALERLRGGESRPSVQQLEVVEAEGVAAFAPQPLDAGGGLLGLQIAEKSVAHRLDFARRLLGPIVVPVDLRAMVEDDDRS